MPKHYTQDFQQSRVHIQNERCFAGTYNPGLSRPALHEIIEKLLPCPSKIRKPDQSSLKAAWSRLFNQGYWQQLGQAQAMAALCLPETVAEVSLRTTSAGAFGDPSNS